MGSSETYYAIVSLLGLNSGSTDKDSYFDLTATSLCLSFFTAPVDPEEWARE